MMNTWLFRFWPHFQTTALLLALLGLSACAATPAASTDESAPEKATTSEPASAAAEPQAGQDAAAAEQDSAEANVAATPAAEEPPVQVAETQPVRIDVSCQNEPYSKYEKQSRDSIAKGLSATTEGIYGVGFRNLEEHKRWSETHNTLFTAVNQACIDLSQCAKQHPKDKTTQCDAQAKIFSAWQTLAEDFANKAKLSETTQPPKLCSLSPNQDDPARCFNGLADNIDKLCDSAECKETSDCWRGIGYLDEAINQAASACGFARTPLAECRGYMTVSQRRKDKFARCKEMQDGLKTSIIPVL